MNNIFTKLATSVSTVLRARNKALLLSEHHAKRLGEIFDNLNPTDVDKIYKGTSDLQSAVNKHFIAHDKYYQQHKYFNAALKDKVSIK